MSYETADPPFFLIMIWHLSTIKTRVYEPDLSGLDSNSILDPLEDRVGLLKV